MSSDRPLRSAYTALHAQKTPDRPCEHWDDQVVVLAGPGLKQGREDDGQGELGVLRANRNDR